MGIPAPKAPFSVNWDSGVRKVRLADANNGWAFGPDLWATHDGGAQWARITLPGVLPPPNVSDLAAGDGVVHATSIDSKGVHILTSPVGRDAWVPSATTVAAGAGPVPHTQVVLQGSSGWLIAVNRIVAGGARLSSGSWVPWDPPCADSGGPAHLGRTHDRRPRRGV